MAERNGSDLANVAQAALRDDPEFLRRLVQGTVQAILEAEMTAHLGAERYARGVERTGYRNGDKPRTLVTRVGTLELRGPQDRDGTFSTALFARYQRTEQALVLTLMEMYLQGVSTRKVAAITEEPCGTSFSKSQVSVLTGRLDADLASWRERPLRAGYPYLCVEARYEHVRIDGRVVSQGVLVVAGVRDDGRREVLAVEVADTEREATYQELFRRLKARGLAGVALVPSDNHAGLRAAVARHFAHGAPGGELAALSGSFRPQSARPGRRQAPTPLRRGATRHLRGRDRAPGTDHRPRRSPGLASQSSAGGRQAGDRGGGLPRLFGLPRGASPPHPDDERLGTVPPGAQTAHPGGAHLPHPRRLAAAGERLGDGTARRVGQRPALPGPGAATGGAAATAGSGGRLSQRFTLEECTELSGFDLIKHIPILDKVS